MRLLIQVEITITTNIYDTVPGKKRMNNETKPANL